MIIQEIFLLVMFVCVCLVLLSGFPVAFVLAGVSLIFALLGSLTGHFDIRILSAFPQRIFSVMTNEVLVAVPLFVFMGFILEKSKIAEDWLTNMGKLFGTLPGGLSISVCVVGALMAASTGIVGATVVTMGLLSLPAMMKANYCKKLATGTICAAGTLGQIIPPSIVLILLGDQLSTAFQRAQFNMGNFSPDTVSVNDLFAGALIPGLVLVGLYIVYQIAVAIFQPHRCPSTHDPLDETEKKIVIRNALKSLIAPLALIVAVLGSILGGLASPTEAAAVGAVGAIMLAGTRLDAPHLPNWLSTGIKKVIYLAVFSFILMLLITIKYDLRMQRNEVSFTEWVMIGICLVLFCILIVGIVASFYKMHQVKNEQGQSVLFETMSSTAKTTSMVFMILIGASMFTLVFRGFGGDVIVEELLMGIPGGTITVLIIVMLVMFLLGFILDFLEIIFIVVPIVAPILLMMEMSDGSMMSPVWLGVMMAINLQTSFLTPPFGFSLFFLRGVAPKSVTTGDIYRGVIPFIGIQILMLFVLFVFPDLATWLPDALYD